CGGGRKPRVGAQLIGVGQVLVAQRDAEHPLRDHALDRVLDRPLDPAVIETGREPGHQPDHPIPGPETPRSGIRGRIAAVERGLDPPPLDRCKPEQVSATLCRHRGAPLRQLKSLWQKSYGRFRAPMYLSPGRVEEGRDDCPRQLRLPSPLIKPDVRVSRIRLSDWLHRRAHGGGPKWTRRRWSTPSALNTVSRGKRLVPCEGTL